MQEGELLPTTVHCVHIVIADATLQHKEVQIQDRET